MERKSVFITGGSRGIGEAVVRRFAQAGWNVAFTYSKNEDLAHSLAGELNGSEPEGGEDQTSKSKRVLPIKLDFDGSGLSDMEKVFDGARTYFGISAFDSYVGNAGISISGILDQMSEDEISRLLKVNLEAQILMTKVASSSMVKEKSGSIVLVSSIWGINGASCESVYTATKAGLIGFGKSMALELGPSGVRVNMVAPGVIDTDMNKGYSNSELDDLREGTPLGRIGQPREVAEAIYFLASDEAGFITGQVLGVDGGFIL